MTTTNRSLRPDDLMQRLRERDRIDVLVVEDDMAFGRLLLDAISARGYGARLATDVAMADAERAGWAPHIILVDGMLPDGNGLDFISDIRGVGFDGPILFMSASWRDAASLVQTARLLDLHAVLHKPFSTSELLAHLDAAAATCKAAAAADRLAPPADRFQSGMVRLRKRFGRTLHARLDELDRALDACASQPSTDPDRMTTAIRVAHNLHGTGGTYGFAEVEAEAGMIEHALRAHAHERTQPDAVFWSRLRESVSRARRPALRSVEADEAGKSDGNPQWSASRSSGTMLWVGGDPSLAEQARAVASRMALNLVPVADEEAALASISRSSPDAAIIVADSDVNRAFSSCWALRAANEGAPLPVAIVAPTHSAGEHLMALQAGAHMVLRAPLDNRALTAGLGKLLAARQRGRPSVLVVDDDPAFQAFVRELLSNHGVRVHSVSDAATLHDSLSMWRPDLLLVDVVMPGLNGFDVCRIVRSGGEFADVPLVLVTSFGSIDARVAAFEAGADDYVTKPVLDRELLARVLPRLERVRVARERQDHDALTGLLRRGAFTQQFDARRAASARRGEPVSLALLDVDHFKAVNDTRGHLVGDEVLRRLGRFLAARYRTEDLRARWGGEEFVVAFFGQPGDTARLLLQAALRDFSRIEFVGDDGAPFSVTFSAGVATSPEDGVDVTALIRTADRRLYRAKAAGRARVS